MPDTLQTMELCCKFFNARSATRRKSLHGPRKLDIRCYRHRQHWLRPHTEISHMNAWATKLLGMHRSGLGAVFMRDTAVLLQMRVKLPRRHLFRSGPKQLVSRQLSPMSALRSIGCSSFLRRGLERKRGGAANMREEVVPKAWLAMLLPQIWTPLQLLPPQHQQLQ